MFKNPQIKSNSEKESNTDLKDVVKNLSQYCNEVVQVFNKGDPSLLKQKFQTFIQNILRVAEDLLNIIKKDSHHGKQTIVAKTKF